MVEVHENERVDDIGFGGLKLIQAPEEFCYGVDAVLLADFTYRLTVPDRDESQIKSIMDLGTGTGIIPLILSYKYKQTKICGVEIQKPSYDRAKRNVEINGLADRISVINADIKDFGIGWGRELKGSFDAVVSNPPYTERSGGLTPSNAAKHIARHETTAELEDFINAAASLLRERGDFFMVHRPSRLAEIIKKAGKYRLEPKNMQLVSPRRGEKPNIMLVHFVKGGNPGINIFEELAVHEEHGGYTRELEERYK